MSRSVCRCSPRNSASACNGFDDAFDQAQHRILFCVRWNMDETDRRDLRAERVHRAIEDIVAEIFARVAAALGARWCDRGERREISGRCAGDDLQAIAELGMKAV